MKNRRDDMRRTAEEMSGKSPRQSENVLALCRQTQSRSGLPRRGEKTARRMLVSEILKRQSSAQPELVLGAARVPSHILILDATLHRGRQTRPARLCHRVD